MRVLLLGKCFYQFVVLTSCGFYLLSSLTHGGLLSAYAAQPVSSSSQASSLSAQDHDFLVGLFPEPSRELRDFYKKAGMTHWPFQYVLGHLDPTKRQVVVVAYSSLSCQHCADFNLNTLWPLYQKYGEEICVIVRDRPLDIYALQATLLTYCYPERTATLQKVLFAHQEEWIPDMVERMHLTPTAAHAWVKEKLNALAEKSGHRMQTCGAYFSFDTLKKAAQMVSQHAAFQKMTVTPVVYLYVPEKGETGKPCHYKAPREIPLRLMEREPFEKLFNQARAELFS